MRRSVEWSVMQLCLSHVFPSGSISLMSPITATLLSCLSAPLISTGPLQLWLLIIEQLHCRAGLV